PEKAWKLCSPVIVKKVEPNRGDAPGHFAAHSSGSTNGLSPSPIRWFHSMRWSTMNAPPPTMVASSHFLAAARSFFLEAPTAITIVKLLDSRHRIMMVRKTMLGLKGKGVGQFWLATRT